ncbi:SLAC1 anion channel family protein [Marinobacterium litorale]|uniref:SLAC1 anion channel family protein n=1 Tax=Marinobacterium litorale TaxID=404770 RepID=UPI000414FB4A|nr:SLAC1 anion channel family protein [Marinobacterium litorale]
MPTIQQSASSDSAGHLQHLPISIFSMIMGSVGLTLSWQKAHETLGAPLLVSQVLLVMAACLMLMLTGSYLLKILRYPQAVLAEWSHPIKISFFPAFSISLVLFSTATLPVSQTLSHILWVMGSFMHLLFTLHVMTQWIHHTRFQVVHSTPAWFIPVVGNILIPIAGVHHGYVELSWFFFAIGLVYWIILKTLIFNRVLFHDPLPQKLLPTLFILIAPPAVGFIAYTQLNGGAIDGFSRILFYASLFLVLLLLTQWRYFIRLPFFISWWAYSFPLAAFSIATQIMHERIGGNVFSVLAWASLALISTLVTVLMLRTLKAAISGQLFQPD